ncbi:hypothetical protein ACSAGD_09780 [Paramicrobacterium sp. CJ85]|uniref:hypothetical protein n=1 Tax=Paramicrobacterium sp. CJ85 TaxID=3445355 RepID=UPI003F5F2689
MAELNARARKIDLDVLGSTIRLEFLNDEPQEHFERLVDAWSGATVARGGPDSTMTVGTNASNAQEYDVYGADYDAVAMASSTKVTLQGIERARGEHLMLHAAGVSLQDGRVAAFVAPSGGGKTTLASHLGKHYGYVSDETIAIDRDLRVYPYRKPLSIIENPEKKWKKTQTSPDALGLCSLPEMPLNLAAIVLFERDDEHSGEPVIGSVALPDAIEDLSGQISYFGDIPDSVCMLADIVEKTGGIRTLRYGEAEGVAAVLADLLTITQPETGWNDASGRASARPDEGEYVRREDVVAVETAGSIITTSDKTLRVLSGLSPTIWSEVESGASLEQIEEALIAQFGAPEGVNTRLVTQQAVDTLLVEGLIRLHRNEPVEVESPL